MTFGVKVTLVEPAGFATGWPGSSAVRASHLPAYDDLRANLPISASARRTAEWEAWDVLFRRAFG